MTPVDNSLQSIPAWADDHVRRVAETSRRLSVIDRLSLGANTYPDVEGKLTKL